MTQLESVFSCTVASYSQFFCVYICYSIQLQTMTKYVYMHLTNNITNTLTV